MERYKMVIIDIAGYAKLIADYLENQQGMIKTIVAYERTN